MTAIVGVVAIVAVMVLIAWGRYALLCAEGHGPEARAIEGAATAARFATGLSP